MPPGVYCALATRPHRTIAHLSHASRSFVLPGDSRRAPGLFCQAGRQATDSQSTQSFAQCLGVDRRQLGDRHVLAFNTGVSLDPDERVVT